MRGLRVIVGLLTMAVVVPFSLCFLLGLHRLTQFLMIAVTCFVAWGVADLCANILVQPRLANRSPSDAIRSWEEGKSDKPADDSSRTGRSS